MANIVFGSRETTGSWLDNVVPIAAITLGCAAIGALIGGTAAALVASKVAFLFAISFYGSSLPSIINGADTPLDRLVGRLLPYFLVGSMISPLA